MGIHYMNLDDDTRKLMLKESQLGGHYISPRLTPIGQAAWVTLLDEAILSHDDDWLAGELLRRGFLRTHETYTRSGKVFEKRINQPHAAQQLAEGEFNRYYLRGLCVRAMAANIPFLIIYRGKQVSQPRPESEARIGSKVDTGALLLALRRNDFVTIEEAFGVPGGPGSGLTARLS